MGALPAEYVVARLLAQRRQECSRAYIRLSFAIAEQCTRSILLDHTNKFIHRLLAMRDSAKVCFFATLKKSRIADEWACSAPLPSLLIAWDVSDREGNVTKLVRTKCGKADQYATQALSDINGSIGICSSRFPVISVIYLGAPHRGLETTALKTLVRKRPTEGMVNELKAQSPILTELNDKFPVRGQRYRHPHLGLLFC